MIERSHTKRALLLLVAGLLTNDSEAMTQTLTGSDFRGTQKSDGLQALSMAGGAEVQIKGQGFDMQPPLNQVVMNGSGVLASLGKVIAPALDDDDVFNSATMKGTLAYTTPSVMTLLSKTYEQFDGLIAPNGSTQKLEFESSVFSGTTEMKCGANTKPCKFVYDRSYTPMLNDVTPANVYSGMLVQYNVNVKNAHTTMNNGTTPVKKMKIGKHNMDYETTITDETRMPAWTPWYLKAKVTDQAASKSDDPMVRFKVGNAQNAGTTRTCNFKGDDCYGVRTHARVDKISKSSGKTSGGQKLVIEGFGLQSDSSSVKVDGVDCEIISSTNKKIQCITGAKATASLASTPQPGNFGIKRTKVSPSRNKTPSWANLIDSSQPKSSGVYTSFEALRNQDDTFGNLFQGYFKAPETGKYRFYISCDDQCKLKFDKTNPFNAASPVTPVLEEIAYTNTVDWRQYFVANKDQKPMSDWMDLEAGKQYSIEGHHIESWHSDHFTVSVEYQANPTPEQAAALTSCNLAAEIVTDEEKAKCSADNQAAQATCLNSSTKIVSQTEKDKCSTDNASSQVTCLGDAVKVVSDAEKAKCSTDNAATEITCQSNAVKAVNDAAKLKCSTDNEASQATCLSNTTKVVSEAEKTKCSTDNSAALATCLALDTTVDQAAKDDCKLVNDNLIATCISNAPKTTTDADKATCKADFDSIVSGCQNALVLAIGATDDQKATCKSDFDSLVTDCITNAPKTNTDADKASCKTAYDTLVDTCVTNAPKINTDEDILKCKTDFEALVATCIVNAPRETPLVDQTRCQAENQALISREAGPTTHPHSTKEVQKFSIEQENISEETEIIIDKVDDKAFTINLLNPTLAKPAYWMSGSIKANASAASMRGSLYPYYSKYFKSNIDVTLVMYDSAGVETADAKLRTKSVYTIKLLKMIGGVTANNILIVKKGTKASITAVPNKVKSSTPLGGRFIISCMDSKGIEWKTNEIPYNSHYSTIQNTILNKIPFLTERVEVITSKKNAYAENGIEFLIYFRHLQADPEQCTITSGTSKQITGNSPVFVQETTRNYSVNKFYEPIPLEFLSTATTSPQVLVTVNGIEAICPKLNCDYTYTDAQAKITSQKLDGNVVEVEGENLPVSNDVEVTISGTACSINEKTATKIKCTMTLIPAAGEWHVDVRDAEGRAKITDGLAKINIPLTVASVTPNKDINFNGGTILTITGTGFPIKTNHAKVQLDDQTVCKVLTVSATQITCKLRKFKSVDSAKDFKVMVTINNIISETATIKQVAAVPGVVGVVPDTASPVLHTNLKITVDGGTLEDGKVFVDLVKPDDEEFKKPLYVTKIDKFNKIIHVKFGGAESGKYKLIVSTEADGALSELDFEAVSDVTSISPISGSASGGTLMTIKGRNFSTDPFDNPVKIGGAKCIVESSKKTEIKCRIEKTTQEELLSVKTLVFLKTSEEAKCSGPCDFTWYAPNAVVSSVASAYDAPTLSHKITMAGTGFGSAGKESAQLLIDGHAQETLSLSDTEVVFKLLKMNTLTSTNINVYFTDGSPATVTGLDTMTIVPSLAQVTPSLGSSGGSLLNIQAPGLGELNTGVNIYNSQSKDNICEKVTFTGMGAFTCLTKKVEVKAIDKLQLAVGNAKFDCGNADLTKCSLVQSIDSSPTVTSIEVTGQVTVLKGKGFPASGYNAFVVIEGIESAQGTITGESVTVDWTSTGVPVSDKGATPQLIFKSTTDTTQLWATVGTDVIFKNALQITASQQGLTCSWNGNCAYEVTASGLAKSLESSSNNIEICGNTATLDSAASDATKAVVRIPALATTHSAKTFSIVETGVLGGKWFGSDEKELPKIFDDSVMMDYVDSKAECHVGVTYKANQVGVLSEAKFFINDLQNNKPFVDKLTMQGSNDSGKTWIDLWAINADVNEGWNSKVWEGDQQPAYNSYRFEGKAKGSCRISEIKFVGVEVVSNNDASFKCEAILNLGQEVTKLSEVTYDTMKTPVLTSISPRFGSVKGGTLVTLTGTGFSAQDKTEVLFDNRACKVTKQTATSIECTTKDKPYVADTPTTKITIAGTGAVATKDLVFRYVSLWSDETTWGDFQPIEGESISIPKGQQLLMDVDSTPILKAVIVEGALIFPPSNDPNHQRSFDARYIMVKGGYFEAGTEEFPYTSKLTITMHSNVSDPYLPIYGNKVLAIRFGQLEMHGVKRNPEWTSMDVTAEKGATKITLIEKVDWKAGEFIAIASTSFEGRDAEKREIKSVDNSNPDKPVIELTEALESKHFAALEKVGTSGDTIEMRAEVGLLTRNIVYRGDPETSAKNQYGAHIMLHSPGDESSIGRIEYVELTDVGQAFKLGRYPLHFHMIGTVHKSYVRGNAIHQTYNRAITIHGVHYFRVIRNVAYDTMGHTVFIEDAAETKCLIDGNLIIQTKASFSLINTDQTPASFWITHPDNQFRNNHAAGSDRYGYWYDTQLTAMGPSFDPNVCPENSKIGEFRDNVAHSNGRYGFRIFHNLIPRKYPCKPLVFDSTKDVSKGEDPYHSNPLIEANFYNLISYKNGRNGAIVERIGSMRFHNFKCADNMEGGIEVSLTSDLKIDGLASVEGGLVVGKTSNTEAALNGASPIGFWGPRTEGFTVNGLKFYNFDFNNAAGIANCSHCWHDNATDSGSRTVRFSGLSFENVKPRIKYHTPFKAIFFDKDGTLTGKGPKSWATPYYPHNDWTSTGECSVDKTIYDGITCNNKVQVRRIAFSKYTPNHFYRISMKIAQWDKDQHKALDEKAMKDFLYDKKKKNFSIIPFKMTGDPTNGWAVPFVTGHKYRVHWGEGLDFESMMFEQSEQWESGDRTVEFVSNFTDQRQALEFHDGSGHQYKNMTYGVERPEYMYTGMNDVYNDTETKLFHWAVSSKSREPVKEVNRPVDKKLRTITMTGIRCVGGCNKAVEKKELGDPVFWSKTASWPDNKLPVEGDSVEIASGVNMFYDLPDKSPKFKLIVVNGALTFNQPEKVEDTIDLHLQAEHIFVNVGALHIGSAEKPFPKKAQITLFGEQKADTQVYDGAIEAGNKAISNIGTIKMYGAKRSRRSRLRAQALKKEKMIIVDQGLDWVAGDKIYLAPTGHNALNSDYVEVESYDSQSGQCKIKEELKFNHFGDSESTSSKLSGIDRRGEVVLLTRSIRIVGDDYDNWGGQIVTSDTIDTAGEMQTGLLEMQDVELYRCSQRDTYKAAIRFEGALTQTQILTGVVAHQGKGWGLYIKSSANVQITESSFVGFYMIGMSIEASQDVKADGLYVMDVRSNSSRKISAGFAIEQEACVANCSLFNTAGCARNVIKNSIAAGCTYAGWVQPMHACDAPNENFIDNVAHSSNRMGAYFYPNPSDGTQGKCAEASKFQAYHVLEQGAIAYWSTPDLRFKDMSFIDNLMGITVMGGLESDKIDLKMENIHIHGEVEAYPDMCPEYRQGLWFSGSLLTHKDLHPTGESALPIYGAHEPGSWGTTTSFKNMYFHDWQSKKTVCGGKQAIFGNNLDFSDYVPKQSFDGVTFENVHEDAVAYLYNPPAKWINVTDCGNFNCTGPKNILVNIKRAVYKGSPQPDRTSANFSIISNNNGSSKFAGCKERKEWNGHWCENKELAILLFESLDGDTWDRSVMPVLIKSERDQYTIKLNSAMDHVWDGFYSGQLRLSRFPALIQGGDDYTLTYTGTPPGKMRYKLDGDRGGVLIKIPYPNAGAYAIYLDGDLQKVSKWDPKTGRNEPLPKRRCGENRFIGIENILEMYLRPGCTLEVKPKDSIQSKVRLNWTMDEFYADGGTVKFADRIAAVLGIHASTIKVVAVYKGSVIIDFFIQAADNDENPDRTLDGLAAKFASKLKDGKVFLGAPILGAYTGGENVEVPQSRGSGSAADQLNGGGFARPDGAAATPSTDKKKQGSAFEWDDSVEQNAVTSNSGRTPTIGTNGDNAIETVEEKNKAQVYIVLLCVAGAILVAIVLAVAARACLFKRQDAEHAAVKQMGPEADLDRQVAEDDFAHDIFAGKTQTQKVNMAENCVVPGGFDPESTTSQFANSATKMNGADNSPIDI